MSAVLFYLGIVFLSWSVRSFSISLTSAEIHLT